MIPPLQPPLRTPASCQQLLVHEQTGLTLSGSKYATSVPGSAFLRNGGLHARHAEAERAGRRPCGLAGLSLPLSVAGHECMEYAGLPLYSHVLSLPRRTTSSFFAPHTLGGALRGTPRDALQQTQQQAFDSIPPHMAMMAVTASWPTAAVEVLGAAGLTAAFAYEAQLPPLSLAARGAKSQRGGEEGAHRGVFQIEVHLDMYCMSRASGYGELHERFRSALHSAWYRAICRAFGLAASRGEEGFSGLDGAAWAARRMAMMAVAPRRRARATRLCAPLTTDVYGDDACLHVSATGLRRVCTAAQLPPSRDAVRLVFVSDTHEQMDMVRLPPGDILCHTGDITFCARAGLHTLRAFNELLATLPFKHKVVIAGNHDRHLEMLGRAQAQELLSEAHYLENTGVWLCGLHIWGTPYSPRRSASRSSNRAFQYHKSRQRLVMRYMPNDVDVLLTHGANGSDDLDKAIQRVQPILHAYGHEHVDHGAIVDWEAVGDGAEHRYGSHCTLSEPNRPWRVRVNAAICDKRYLPVQLPVVVDLVPPRLPRLPSLSRVADHVKGRARRYTIASCAPTDGEQREHRYQRQLRKKEARQQQQQRQQRRQQRQLSQQQQPQQPQQQPRQQQTSPPSPPSPPSSPSPQHERQLQLLQQQLRQQQHGQQHLHRLRGQPSAQQQRHVKSHTPPPPAAASVSKAAKAKRKARAAESGGQDFQRKSSAKASEPPAYFVSPEQTEQTRARGKRHANFAVASMTRYNASDESQD